MGMRNSPQWNTLHCCLHKFYGVKKLEVCGFGQRGILLMRLRGDCCRIRLCWIYIRRGGRIGHCLGFAPVKPCSAGCFQHVSRGEELVFQNLKNVIKKLLVRMVGWVPSELWMIRMEKLREGWIPSESGMEKIKGWKIMDGHKNGWLPKGKDESPCDGRMDGWMNGWVPCGTDGWIIWMIRMIRFANGMIRMNSFGILYD